MSRPERPERPKTQLIREDMDHEGPPTWVDNLVLYAMLGLVIASVLAVPLLGLLVALGVLD